MATFVLIHGSFVGGWIWQPTVNVLRQAGHSVYVACPDSLDQKLLENGGSRGRIR